MSSPDFAYDKVKALRAKKFQTLYNEQTGEYLPVKRTIVGTARTYLKSEEFIQEKEAKRREQENASFEKALTLKIKEEERKE